MAKLGKWIAGGLGWAFFGPLGGLLGYAVGSLFENADIQQQTQGKTTSGDFALSLMVLVAAVMKADGTVKRSELDYVKDFFKRSFGTATASEAVKMLRDLLNRNIPVREVSMQIRNQLDYSSRLQLLHFLYGISAADSVIHPSEVEIIDLIAGYMGISAKDRLSVKSMFVEETDTAYKILEVEKNASDEDIKKAYRKMANKHHPDKVSYLGEDIKKAAEEKFRKINEAYEKIKKERGIK